MALNKKNTTLLTRIGIGFVAVLMLLAFMPGVFDFFSSGPAPDDALDDAAANQADQIAATYYPTVASLKDNLASDPTSYTVLVTLGNTYSDWAREVGQISQNGAGLPMWDAATIYYDRALETTSSDPAVLTDSAIAHYYSGDATGAIALVEKVMVMSPEFAPAFFNAGVFYNSAGMSDKAVTAMKRYLELDPQGQYGNTEYANKVIAGTADTDGTQ